MSLCYFLFIPNYLVFTFVLSLFQELIFWFKKVDIFDWNPETGSRHLVLDTSIVSYNKKDGKELQKRFWEERSNTYESAPIAWKIYRFLLELIGIFVGWILVVLSFKVILNAYFFGLEVSWNIILSLLVGLIGISGRIPVIIDSVQDWFKR